MLKASSAGVARSHFIRMINSKFGVFQPVLKITLYLSCANLHVFFLKIHWNSPISFFFSFFFFSNKAGSSYSSSLPACFKTRTNIWKTKICLRNAERPALSDPRKLKEMRTVRIRIKRGPLYLARVSVVRFLTLSSHSTRDWGFQLKIQTTSAQKPFLFSRCQVWSVPGCYFPCTNLSQMVRRSPHVSGGDPEFMSKPIKLSYWRPLWVSYLCYASPSSYSTMWKCKTRTGLWTNSAWCVLSITPRMQTPSQKIFVSTTQNTFRIFNSSELIGQKKKQMCFMRLMGSWQRHKWCSALPVPCVDLPPASWQRLSDGEQVTVPNGCDEGRSSHHLCDW